MDSMHGNYDLHILSKLITPHICCLSFNFIDTGGTFPLVLLLWRVRPLHIARQGAQCPCHRFVHTGTVPSPLDGEVLATQGHLQCATWQDRGPLKMAMPAPRIRPFATWYVRHRASGNQRRPALILQRQLGNALSILLFALVSNTHCTMVILENSLASCGASNIGFCSFHYSARPSLVFQWIVPPQLCPTSSSSLRRFAVSSLRRSGGHPIG